jgi:hypothetical protein
MPGTNDYIIAERARHFGRGDRHGGWTWAADVACCVRLADPPTFATDGQPTMTDVATAAGVTQVTVSRLLGNVPSRAARQRSPNQHDPEATRQRVLEAAERLGYRPPSPVPAWKISARAFARLAGGALHADTVIRYLKAWDSAADAGLVPPSASLAPDDDPPLPPAERWDEFYRLGRYGCAEGLAASRRQEGADQEHQELLDSPPPSGDTARDQLIDALQGERHPAEPPDPEQIWLKVSNRLRRAHSVVSAAIGFLRDAPPLDGEEVEDIREDLARLRAALDMIESLAEHGGVSDEAIQQFLDGTS